MVGYDGEDVVLQVPSQMLNSPYHSEAFQFRDAIIFLRGIQGAISVGNHPFAVLLMLGEDGPEPLGASVGLQYEPFGEIRTNEYNCGSQSACENFESFILGWPLCPLHSLLPQSRKGCR